MMHSHSTVRFYVDHISHGFQEAKGLLSFENDALTFEYEISDSVTGIIKSGLKKTRVPFSELTSIQIRERFLRVTRIEVRSRSMSALSDVPGSDAANVILKIRKTDRDDARNFVSAASLALSEFRLAQLNDHEDS
jgi:hypothetical protein